MIANDGHADRKPGAVMEPRAGSPAEDVRLAYLMTHYPRVALTFIHAEIDAMRRQGIAVWPIAMNLPGTQDVPTRRYRDEAAVTFYLKSSPALLLLDVILTVITHPLVSLRLLGRAFGSSRLDLPVLARRVVHLAYAMRTARKCRAAGINHIHAHFGQAPATIAWFACELLNARSPLSCKWSFTIHGFQDFVESTSARLDLKARSASFIACISDFTKAQLCQTTEPQYWDRFHVVRCGVNPDSLAFRSARPMREIPTVLLVGRLSPEKGHIILLEAQRRLRDRGVHIRTRFVGDGPFRPDLERLADQLGLRNLVAFEGEQLPEAVSAMLEDADIFCLPSFSEGLPVSIMEAMAKGVPVVTTWISGIPELAQNEKTALTVPASNVEALASALARMITDEDLRQMMTVNARTAIEHGYNAEANAAILAGMFRSLREINGSLQSQRTLAGESIAADSPVTEKGTH